MILYYLMTQSLRRLSRIEGLPSTFILCELVCIMALFIYDVFLFFSHLLYELKQSVAVETDPLEVQMSMGPIMGFTLFKYASLFLAILMILLTITTIKRNFKQYFILQHEDFKIMSYLGETPGNLAIYYTFQVAFFALFVITIAMIASQLIFFASVIKTINLGVTLSDVQSFRINPVYLIILELMMLTYVFLTTFFSSKKKLYSLTSK